MMNAPKKRLVVIGKAARPFGVRGEIKIDVYTESFEPFERSSVLIFDDSPHKVLGARVHKGAVLVTLEGVETPERAREFAGKLVKTEHENLPPKEEDEYYWSELIGMEVSTTEGRNLGAITQITRTGAHDVLHVEGPLGEILLPYIDEVVIRVDTDANLMIVDPLEGLVPDA